MTDMLKKSAGLLIGVVCVVIGGCTVNMTDGQDNTTQDNTTKTVRIVFDNQADVEVDPHFYRSDKTLSANDLFTNAANRYQNFSGKTTIAAKTNVPVDFPAD